MTTLNLLLLAGQAALASVVLPALARLLVGLCPRSAARRRLVWTTMFAMLLILPLAAAIAPSLAVITLAAAPIDATAALPAAPPPDAAPQGLSTFAQALGVIVITWAFGAILVSARGLGGLLSLRSLRRGSVPAAAERLPVAVPRGCSVRLSADCAGPMTWGVIRPVILLPDDAFDWPAARLEAALRHELAHVRSRDSLVQAMALLTSALYWPNPLLRWAAGALRREAEAAADDAVIAAGVRPSDYAAQLLDIAREWHAPQPMSAGLAMAAPPILTERVQSILSTDAIRTGATSMDALKLVLIGGGATAVLALARPSVAEVPAPAPATQAELAPLAAPAPIAEPAPPAVRPPAPDQAVHARPAGKHAVELALQDVPAPPAAAAPAAPPAPPQPAWIPAPGALPPLPPAPPGAVTVRGAFGPQAFNLKAMTPEQRAELDRQLAQIAPAINKAIADAHIDEAVQKALASQDPKTRELVARQLAELGPTIQRAVAAAHIQEMVQQRMAELGPQMQEAMKKVRAQAADAEDRAAARLEEEAKRARERAKRDRENQPLPPAGPGNLMWIPGPGGDAAGPPKS